MIANLLLNNAGTNVRDIELVRNAGIQLLWPLMNDIMMFDAGQFSSHFSWICQTAKIVSDAPDEL